MIYLLPIVLASATACSVAGEIPSESSNATQSQPSPKLPPRCKSGSLELELTPSRAVITLGEPTAILVTLRNCAGAPIEVPANLEPEYSEFQLTVTPPVGETFRYSPPVLRETRRKLTVLLEPGATRGAAIQVYLHRAGWLLNSAGEYTFNGTLNADKGVITAPQITLRVQPAPQGVTQDRLATVWKALGPSLYFQSTQTSRASVPFPAVDKNLAYLDSYIKIARLLATSQQKYDPVTDKFIGPECADLGETVLTVTTVPDPYFAAIGTSRISPCLSQRGKGAEARQLVGKVRAAYPELSAHPELARLLANAEGGTPKSK